MLGYDSYAISTNFGEVSANLVQAGDVGSAQVAMGALAIAAMLALLLCYCLFEPTETGINRGKVQPYIKSTLDTYLCHVIILWYIEL